MHWGRSTESDLTRSEVSSNYRGSLTIHSCPIALVRHVEWSLQSITGIQTFNWRNQPMVAGAQRMQLEWRRGKDLIPETVTALKSWHYLRFEANSETEIFRFTPDLGLHRATIDSLGSILLTENQIRSALDSFDMEITREKLELALGTNWERELEPFRGVDLQEVSHLRAI